MGKTNIRQIAERAGVSTAAVSYVLNGKAGVSPETRKRILQVIREEKYTPNVNSRRLIYRRSYNLFLVTDSGSTLTNLFYSAVMGALAEECDSRGYSLVLSGKKDDFCQTAAFQAIRQSNVDGLIFLFDPDEETKKILGEEQTPYVVMDSHKKNPGYPCVRADYEEAAYTAVRYLITMKHTCIGLLGRAEIPDYYEAFLSGYRRALEEGGIPFCEELVYAEREGNQHAAEGVQRLLSGSRRPTAILCAGDLSALAAMTRTRQLGLSIPEDVSFVSVDDLPVSELYHPALTTVRIDAREMAQRAVELLERQMEEGPGAYEAVISSGNLICRDSVSPPGEGKAAWQCGV